MRNFCLLSLKRPTPIYLLFCLFLLGPVFSYAQADLAAGTDWQRIDYNGTYQDFKVPNDFLGVVYFRMFGGDGGFAKVQADGTCTGNGGSGAEIYQELVVGNGPDEIPPGSTIRFIVGQRGDNHGTNGGCAYCSRSAGGGGGTGILVKIDDEWTILSVAGGGGGGYAKVFNGFCAGDTSNGLSANTSEDGAGLDGPFSGADGGTDGNGGGGGSNVESLSNSGGGGGVKSAGYDSYEEDDSGQAGWENYPNGEPTGGVGGSSSTQGGFGFGGGGGGGSAGGGGGGYSGGGGGRNERSGGGGGSWINPDYSLDYSIRADPPTGDTKNGYVQYRLEYKCFIEIANITVDEPENCDSQGATVTATLDRTLPCATNLTYDLYDISDPDDRKYVDLSLNGVFENVAYGEFAIVVGNIPYGPMDTATFVVNASGDIESPIARCKDITVTLNEDGTYGLTPEEVDDNSTDDCGINSYSLVDDEGDGAFEQILTCDQVGDPNFKVGLAVTDYAGQTAICEAKVTVLDGTPPILPDDLAITVYLDDNGEGALILEDISQLATTDICGDLADLTYTMDFASAQYNCADIGQAVTHELTVSDAAGNTDVGTLSVTVLDHIPPTIVCQDVTIDLSDQGTATINHLDFIVSADDNCMSEAEIITGYSWDSSILPQIVGCSHIGDHDIALLTSAVDYESNLPACEARLTIRDGGAPIISCRDTTIYLDQGNSGFTQETLPIESLSDACHPNSALSLTWKNTQAFFCSDIGSDEEAWIEVKDPDNNIGRCTFTVTVVDTTTATVSCRDQNINLTGNNNYTYTLRPEEVYTGLTSFCNTTEDRPGTLSFSVDSDPILDCDDLGSPQTLTLIFTPDDGSPASSCNSTITVREGIAPQLSCPSGIIDVEATYEDCGALYEYEYTAWDTGCPEIDVTLLEGLPSGSAFPVGWNDVRIQATDKEGNASICAFVVRVASAPARPTLSCPADYTVNIEDDACSIVIDTSATFDQTCLVQNTQYLGPNMGSAFEVGTYTFGFRTRNPQTGLSSQCSFNVKVDKADKKSVAVCKEDMKVVLTNGQVEIPPSEFDGGSYDNCYGLDRWTLYDEFNFSTRIFNCASLGEKDYRLRVYNTINQWSECNIRLNFVLEAPQCQDITVTLDDLGSASINPSDIFISRGNCTNRYTTEIDQSNFDCSDLGTTIVTLTRTAPDDVQQCTANVTVQENELVESCANDLLLSAKIFLEGPYNSNTHLMNDDLRSLGMIPGTSPYTNTTKTVSSSVLSLSGSNAIVDWVFIELRNALDNTEVMHSRAALLQRDGDVVDVDGVSPVTFTEAEADDYYIVIRHRNHLGIMTSATQSLSDTPTIIDFTTSGIAVYGSNSRINLEAGVMGLYGADSDGSGSINASDRSATWNDRNQSGYLDSDCNLDGYTNATDRGAAWNNRNMGGTLPE